MAKTPGNDEGFTLVELMVSVCIAMSIVLLSVSALTNMTQAVAAQKHIDLALSTAGEVMEFAGVSECGSQIVDSNWVPGDTNAANISATTSFYLGTQTRCKNYVNEPVGGTAAIDASFCPGPTSGTDTWDSTFRNGYLPPHSQAQNDLGSNRYTIYKKAQAATAYNTFSNFGTGTIPICVTKLSTWKYVSKANVLTSTDDGTNASLRLERKVHVQWKEPGQTRTRFRELLQLAAQQPDSKISSYPGRITLQVGVGKSATMQLPNSVLKMTYAANSSGWVIFPFLPPATYTIERPSDVVTVTVTATNPSQCIPTVASVVSVPFATSVTPCFG
jgi:type II secretory pathway pseudopilin PulG